MIEETIKSKIVGILSILFPCSKIYLFGSRATDSHQRSSDIDIAIDNQHEMPSRDLYEANSVMEALNIPYKVDVVDLNSISPTMRSMIEKEKVVWKS